MKQNEAWLARAKSKGMHMGTTVFSFSYIFYLVSFHKMYKSLEIYFQDLYKISTYIYIH